jgi:glycosyltransferase involved in cell wall biosynthesis
MRTADVVCLSHVPWSVAIERPHQVMRRLARGRRVFFVEDPVVSRGRPRAQIRASAQGDVHVVSVRVPPELDGRAALEHHRRSIETLARKMDLTDPVLWVYSPAAFEAASRIARSVVVYDCIADPPPGARGRELELLSLADVVFTATDALFEAKRGSNVSTYPVPSGVDAEHFAPARGCASKRAARAPRAGVLGMIDANVDLELLDQLAVARPRVKIDLVGPLVGVDERELPRRPNVRWLGARPYDELPGILAAWDVAILPWRLDEASRRVEPASLLACLASGVPVVATPIDAVVERYGRRGPVTVAAPDGSFGTSLPSFVDALDVALAIPKAVRRPAIEAVLARTSWDRTANVMDRLAGEALIARELRNESPRSA